jgi:hypothetical protein
MASRHAKKSDSAEPKVSSGGGAPSTKMHEDADVKVSSATTKAAVAAVTAEAAVTSVTVEVSTPPAKKSEEAIAEASVAAPAVAVEESTPPAKKSEETIVEVELSSPAAVIATPPPRLQYAAIARKGARPARHAELRVRTISLESFEAEEEVSFPPNLLGPAAAAAATSESTFASLARVEELEARVVMMEKQIADLIAARGFPGPCMMVMPYMQAGFPAVFPPMNEGARVIVKAAESTIVKEAVAPAKKQEVAIAEAVVTSTKKPEAKKESTIPAKKQEVAIAKDVAPEKPKAKVETVSRVKQMGGAKESTPFVKHGGGGAKVAPKSEDDAESFTLVEGRKKKESEPDEDDRKNTNCRNDGKCAWSFCAYKHPVGWSAQANKPCDFGPKCTKRNTTCKFNHDPVPEKKEE